MTREPNITRKSQNWTSKHSYAANALPMAPLNEFKHGKKQKRRHKNNPYFCVIEIDNSTTLPKCDNIDITNPHDSDALEVQDVWISNILTGSITMGRAIIHLVPLCLSNVYLAHPSVLSKAHHFNTTLSQILRACNIPTATLNHRHIIMFPTCFGVHSFGHWFLTILQHDNNDTNRYILD